MRRLRTSIVGCGKVGHIHARALGPGGLAESELVAVSDESGERARAFAARYGVRAFEDPGAMLAQAGAEAVCICTPHPAHRQPAVLAARAGVHVLVEKPMAACLADCDAMIAAARAGNVKLAVISQRRFYEPVVRLKAAIDAGKIGTPVLATVLMLSWRDEAYYRSDPWRGRWDTEGGGVLVNQAPHHLDLMRWFMGPIQRISGACANLNHPYIEVEDTALAIVHFRSGALGSILTSLSQRPGIYTKLHVHGSNGASVGVETDTGATFVAGMTGVLDPPLNDLWTIPGEEPLLSGFQADDRSRFGAVDPTFHYHALQIRDFLRAVQEDREPAVTAADGRAVVEMFAAIYRSSHTGLPVDFPV
ncbi:MAG: Gfo/Idh/MocA family protein [Bryobacteraceae bacterium]